MRKVYQYIHATKSPPPIRIEITTPIAGIPVEFPRILGPKMFPSNCWIARIIMQKITTSFKLDVLRRMSNALGIAPKKGPKNGTMFVIPTITEIINPIIRNSKNSTINTTSLSHSKNYEVWW